MVKLRVFVADDHAIMREGLRVLIATQPDMEVVAEAHDGEGIARAVEAARADVVVMDISMPVVNGTEATREIRRRLPSVRVLVLTAHEDSVYIQLLLEAGASGYLLKRAAAADLVRAIRAVAAGQLYLDTTSAAQIRVAPQSQIMLAPPLPADVRPDPARKEEPELSDREAEVLRMIAMGYSMKRMAAALGLSTRTLETYKHRGMSKLDLENRADVVRFALQRGWLKG